MRNTPDDIEIRFATPADGRALLDLKLDLDGETTNMMFEPGERQPDPVLVEQDIKSRSDAANSVVIVAVDGGQIVGYVEANGGEFMRTRHLAKVVAGVRASHRGRGLGSRLFRALTEWADEIGLLRLELTVMEHNEIARRLYRTFGFEDEGTRVCSMMVDGACIDEIAMARIAPGDFAGRSGNG